MPDPNLPMLEDAVRKLAPFLEEIVFVGGVTLGLLIAGYTFPGRTNTMQWTSNGVIYANGGPNQ